MTLAAPSGDMREASAIGERVRSTNGGSRLLPDATVGILDVNRRVGERFSFLCHHLLPTVAYQKSISRSSSR